MTPRHHQRPSGLEVRILTAIAVLGLIYAGIGWGLRLLGMPAWAIVVLAGAVLAVQWFGTMASSWVLALEWLARGLTGGTQAGARVLRLDPLSEVGLLVVAVAVAAMATAVVSAITHLPLRALSRYRELAADRTAAVHLGQPALLASALVKVDDEQQGIPTADLRGRGVPAIGFVARPGGSGGWFSTHPSLARRLGQLDTLLSELR